MNPLEDDADPTPAETGWWERGGHPPWKRLWVGGVDVTDHPIEEWVEPIARLTSLPRSRAGSSRRVGNGF